MNLENSNITTLSIVDVSMEEYSGLLKTYGLKYQKDDCYYIVGDPDWEEGWILDISIIQIQISALLTSLLPILLSANVPFKIIRNTEVAEFVLEGKMGFELLGKIVSIYPSTDASAAALAAQLVSLTKSLRGPRILTDICLGGCVYTRYGKNPYITDRVNENLSNHLQIAFIPDPNKAWPFSRLAEPIVRKKQSILNNKYRPMFTLKEDAKGGVQKALYLERPWRVKWCVIKEAKFNMNVDNVGRSGADRLRWQYEVNRKLSGILPLPKIFHLFEDDCNTYLTMEFIKGDDLDSTVSKIYDKSVFGHIEQTDWNELLTYAIDILDIIGKMHSSGYLHRDITPANFLVTGNKSLVLIDLELCYHFSESLPCPPFRLGTQGFMSPEQQSIQKPTLEQDIFGLGGTLITLLTGLLPGLLAFEDKETLKSQLSFFIPNSGLVNDLGNCFDTIPENRPTVAHLRTSISEFAKKRRSTTSVQFAGGFQSSSSDNLRSFVTRAVAGLATPCMLTRSKLWVSKTESIAGISHQLRSVSVYPHFHNGLSGVMYVVARSQELGIRINPCIEAYKAGLSFLKDERENGFENTGGGLFDGSAGIALSLLQGVKSGLIQKDGETTAWILALLTNDRTIGYGFVKGLAGRGMALLSATKQIGDQKFGSLLENLVNDLIHAQHKQGYWLAYSDSSGKSFVPLGMSHGVSGILCFLVSYLQINPSNKRVEKAVVMGLEWLANMVKKRRDLVTWPINNKKRICSQDLNSGTAGVVLAFIKGYDILRTSKYKELAETCLRSYLAPRISSNITLGNGLVGIGESILEAASVFKTGEWHDQANWITQFLLHRYRVSEEDSFYWQADGSPIALPGLVEGNSGVIHFLLRQYSSITLSHPFLT